MYFKVKDTRLCADCDIIFTITMVVLSNYTPMCPICGTKSILNVGGVLNRAVDMTFASRKEVKGEDNNYTHIGVSDKLPELSDISQSNPRNQPIQPAERAIKTITDSSIKGRIADAEPGDSASGGDSTRTNRAIGFLVDLFNAHRIRIQCKGRFFQKL